MILRLDRRTGRVCEYAARTEFGGPRFVGCAPLNKQQIESRKEFRQFLDEHMKEKPDDPFQIPGVASADPESDTH